MDVRYEQVSKSFSGVDALIQLDLDIPDGTFLALLGPSGCGKTTALRILAGLEEPTSGSVHLGDRDVTRLQPKDRDVAMVFQSYALYPHKSVADNIAYPLRVRKVPKNERGARVAEVARLLSIDGLLERMPRALSGGQRQRVALARAIVREPRVFLMDEPLSNLDAQLRLQMRIEIKRLQKQLGVTTLYVTHDQVEAMTMADMVAVMHDGRLQQLATPADLYARPANLFVARFCGSPPMNVLEGEISGAAFAHPQGTVALRDAPMRGRARLGFRPEHGQIVAADAAGALRGEVYVVEPLGNETLITVALEGELVNLRAAAGVEPAIGTPVGILPDRNHLHLFDADTGASITAAPTPKEEPVPTDAMQSTPPSDPALEGGALHERQPEQ
ncbi:MAG TPA: ABC transporter ATP-binding protein [Gaiellales bacterium]|nr:ABC transporter ATP-binding protein [Gaiellales bacterium]